MPSFTNARSDGEGSGLRVPEDGGHRHHGDLRRDVVAQHLSAHAPPPPVDALRARRAGRAGARRERARGAHRTRPTSSKRAPRNPTASPAASAKTIQPVFAPLGYDWQLTVGVLTSFLAREVFVSTMSVLLGGIDRMTVEDLGVIAAASGRRLRDDGRRSSRRRHRRVRWSSSSWRCSVSRRWR